MFFSMFLQFSITFSKDFEHQKKDPLPLGPGESDAIGASSGQGSGERIEEGEGGRLTSYRLGLGIFPFKMCPWQTQTESNFELRDYHFRIAA